MTDKTTAPSPITTGAKTDKKMGEKPFTDRMQRLLTGQNREDVILDPDNPNLILERKRDASS